MATVEYRLFFDNEAADQKRLDQVDSIVVEQQVDMAWEARLSIPVCVNGDGKWEGEDEAWMLPFKRVRVEIKVGKGGFVALIDGPIVGHDSGRSTIPGKSTVTLVVHDDSALLHRKRKIERYSGSDSDIARQIFEQAQLGGTPDIDDTANRPGGSPYEETMQLGTDMQMLRTLARRNPSWHAYVLPGSQPGQSIGCFKRLPTETDGLPALIMLGDGRNMANFDWRNNARSPAQVQGATMSLKDKKILTATASYRDASLLGDDPPPTGSGDTVKRLPPGQGSRNDLDSLAAGAAADSGFSAEATGSVLSLCYDGVLSPYRAVEVRLSDSAQSGKYVLFKVTHTLTRSEYTQSFTVRGNAVSTKSAASASKPAASASFSASFNVQVGIF